MIHLIDKVWIGTADLALDGRNMGPLGITALLNVANDLKGNVGWPVIEYAQVGLMDGPGNPLTSYIAAALTLDSLCRRHGNVLVCCHGGSRSMAVVIMYLNLHGFPGWGAAYDLLRERVDIDLPVPHDAHIAAFNKIDWKSVQDIVNALEY